MYVQNYSFSVNASCINFAVYLVTFTVVWGVSTG